MPFLLKWSPFFRLLSSIFFPKRRVLSLTPPNQTQSPEITGWTVQNSWKPSKTDNLRQGKKTDVGTVGFNTFNGYLYALYQFTTGACANPCIEKLMKYTDRTFPSSHCHSLRSNCTLLSFYLSFPSAFCFTKLIKMRPVSLPFFLCVFFFYVALQACRE